MLRLFAQLVLNVLSSAVGLFVASLLLSGFSINGIGFVIAVLIFSGIEFVIDPLITKLALTSVPALRGGVALITTFVSLLLTVLISNGISISGISTWVLATLIVWLFSLIATLLLPLVLFRKTLENRKS